MKTLPLWILLTAVAGCATAAPEPISAQQAKAFRDSVHAVEHASADGECPQAEAALRTAQSDFYYAEHSPMNPDRARVMAVQAQEEADSAVALSQSRQ
jgi:hypothetical protein